MRNLFASTNRLFIAKLSGRWHALLLVAGFITVVPVTAAPEESWGNVSGKELREILSGNTVTGRHDDGMPYSEWHAPDGRVLGHNNREAVEKGCWDIRGSQVCYYYAGGTIRGEFCWEFRQVTESGYRLRSVSTGMQATGLAQAGNPHGHGDGGKPWTCEPLQSRLMTPRERYASRPAR